MTDNADKRKKMTQGGYGAGGAGAVYGMGLIGALVYYVQHADGFWPIVLAVLKALVWPAFLVYHLLKYLAV